MAHSQKSPAASNKLSKKILPLLFIATPLLLLCFVLSAHAALFSLNTLNSSPDAGALSSGDPASFSFLSAPDLVSTQNINSANPQSNILIDNHGLLALSIPSDQEVTYLNNNADSIFIYYVEKGDTLGSIAQKFNISIDTLVWTNNLSSRNVSLKAGQELTILPVSGVLYTIKGGDTIQSIAKQFKADPQDIIAFNNLDEGTPLPKGIKIVIPDGQAVQVPQGNSSGNTSSGSGSGTTYPYQASNPGYVQALTPAGFLVYPTTGLDWGRLHYDNAVDIAGTCGTPVYAAASGTVIRAAITDSRSRFANGGYGNHIRILHSNGVITLYAHLEQVLVQTGQTITQGQLIGYMGGRPGMIGAGNSTGCHLHFEVRGATNPLAR